MDLRLKGQVAVVTGASKGIGLAVTATVAKDRAANITGSDSSSTAG